VKPVTFTLLPSVLFNVKVPDPLSYVPPVIDPVKPVMVIVPPLLSYKSKLDVPEK
jgi:hypothetical protein